MSIVDKIRNKMGANQDTEEYVEEPAAPVQEEEPEENRQQADNVVDFKNKAKTASQMKVMVIEPVSFDDAQQVADHIRNHKPVVVNFENTNGDIAKRIIDFISGTTYALSGDIKKVGKNVFMCAPDNVSVNFSEETKKQPQNTAMPWED
ncbi:cell division protein SepF [Megamonas hypermegale]|uniref:cell division protein SepF n=1 Tax=Megamonas hypermegale TaxID=158847 RepID=UPI00255CC418|nr:cell division protein SepF [Megamonas hypermegale]